jgi:Rrf2 family protein
MKISAKTEYACIAVLELAKKQNGSEPVRIRTISEQHLIPSRFLVQILLQLKGAGIVSSTRGISGGYRLVPKPKNLTLGQVMSIIEGPVSPPSPKNNLPPNSRSINDVFYGIWNAAEQKRQNYLYRITFADLIAKCEHSLTNSPAQLFVSPPVLPVDETPTEQESKMLYA